MASALGVLGIIGTMAVSMFPVILPSSSQPGMSLTVWDASSSHFTLVVMLVVTGILLPIVVSYTGWAFRIMRGKVTKEYVRENEHSAY